MVTDIVLIIILGLFAGFTGPLTASSAMLIIPSLIFLEFSAHEALALNIFASFISWIIITLKLNTEENIKWNLVPALAVLSACGAFLGASIVVNTAPETMAKVVGALMIIIVLFLIFKKDVGANGFTPSRNRVGVGMVLYTLGATYSGFFAGGSGIILRTINLTFFGFTIPQSAATGGVLWILMSGVTSLVYALNGYLGAQNLIYVFFLTASMSLGSYFGAKYMLKASAEILKKVFIVAILCMGILLVMRAV